MTAADIRDAATLVPEKAKVFWYTEGSAIQVVAEWREGDQPMRRILVVLPQVFVNGGACA